MDHKKFALNIALGLAAAGSLMELQSSHSNVLNHPAYMDGRKIDVTPSDMLCEYTLILVKGSLKGLTFPIYAPYYFLKRRREIIDQYAQIDEEIKNNPTVICHPFNRVCKERIMAHQDEVEESSLGPML